MIRRISFAVLVFALAAAASAAEIHGTLSDGGKPLAKGIPIKLDCAGTTAAASTDDFGGYSLKIAATGPCKLSVDYKGGTGSISVAVYEKPSRYDLAVQEEAGKVSLTRK